MTEQKNKKKTGRELKKLTRTVSTLASIIDSIATSMKGDIDIGEECDIKQLKELTGAAKELSALITSLDSDTKEESGSTVTVYFEGESEKWAK